MGFSQEVVAVLGVPDDADSETTTRMVRELARAVSGEGGGGRRSFSTGVSRRIDSADALPQAYEQARKAVAVGRQMHGASALMHFDGLGDLPAAVAWCPTPPSCAASSARPSASW